MSGKPYGFLMDNCDAQSNAVSLATYGKKWVKCMHTLHARARAHARAQ
jgi:hypothetical protein